MNDYIPDDQRDVVIQKLLTIPDNKVSYFYSPNIYRFASIALQRTQNGALHPSEFSFATNVPETTEEWESILPSLGLSKWTGGRPESSSRWSSEAIRMQGTITRRMVCSHKDSHLTIRIQRLHDTKMISR